MLHVAKCLTVKGIEVEEVVRDPPGIVLGPTVNDQAVSTQIRNVEMRVLAVIRIRVDYRVGEERIRHLVRTFQRIDSQYLQCCREYFTHMVEQIEAR